MKLRLLTEKDMVTYNKTAKWEELIWVLIEAQRDLTKRELLEVVEGTGLTDEELAGLFGYKRFFAKEGAQAQLQAILMAIKEK